MAAGRGRVHFFLAHAGTDRDVALALRTALRRRRKTVFLDLAELLPGDPWQNTLKHSISRCDIIVVLVSPKAGEAWYLQEEVALGIELVRARAAAGTQGHVLVPVLINGATRKHLPYGTTRLHMIDATGPDGLRIAASQLARLHTEVQRRDPFDALSGAVAAVDEIWDKASAPYRARGTVFAKPHRMHIAHHDGALVATVQGHEVQRITRAQFARRLSADQLDLIESLEASMEINKALWKRSYPRRALRPSEKAKAEAAVEAMAEDLDGVLRMLTDAGFFLDDHYQFIRDLTASHLQRPPSPLAPVRSSGSSRPGSRPR